MLRMGFGCFCGMVRGVMQMPLGHLRVMRGGVVIASIVVRSRVPVMASRVFVVLCCLMVMLCCLLRHGVSLSVSRAGDANVRASWLRRCYGEVKIGAKPHAY
jgi:hypothetical protein